MKLVTRAECGLRPPRARTSAPLSAEDTCHWNGPKITVAGKLIWDHSRCAGLIRGIQNFHMDDRKWNDIAYNFIECPHGYTFEGRGLNIINGANGTTSGNRSSHAIMCLAGQTNPFPEKEKIGFRECVSYIAKHTLAPDGRCKGHRDHKLTECPGDERYHWVRRGMPLAQVPVVPPIVKKGKKMDTFLYQLVGEDAVWLVSGDLMSKRWVESREHLEGYQSLLQVSGLPTTVHRVAATEVVAIAIGSMPAVGPVPEGYTGPRV